MAKKELSVLGYIKDIFKRPLVYKKFWTSALTFTLGVLSVVYTDSVILTAIIGLVGNTGVLALSNRKF